MKIEHIITILNQGKKGKQRQKGIVRPSRLNEPLPRRLRDNNIYVRLFDFGQLANGTDAEFQAVIELSDFFLFPSTPIPTMTSTAESHTGTLPFNDFVFLDDYHDFPTIYKEFTADFADYFISLTSITDFVANKGLLVPPGVTTVQVTGTSPYFKPVNIGSPTGLKYTSSPTYASSSVAFVLDKSVDIFLTPHLTSDGDGSASQEYGEARTEGAGTYPFLPATEYLPQPTIRPVQRSSTLNDADFTNIWNNRDFVNHVNITQPQRDFFKELRMNPIDMYEMSLTTNSAAPASVSLVSGAGFPSGVSGAWTIPPYLNLYSWGFAPGNLLAVIRKHLTPSSYEWYFVWATAGGFNTFPIFNLEV